MPTKPKDDMAKTLPDYVAGFPQLCASSKGIERLTAIFLYALWSISLSFWLRVIFSGIFRWSSIVELYVVSSVVITIVAWLWVPTFWSAIICSYFLGSTVVVLLHVVLLSKFFGNPESAERSLILFLCNVVQLIFTFSIWYEVKDGQTKGDALFNVILVFSTVGYPDKAPHILVGAQIATDFLLLAIFLAFILGRIGYRQDGSNIEPNEKAPAAMSDRGDIK